MIRIVNEIMIGPVGRSLAIVSVNEDGVVDVEDRIIREIRDEKFAAGEGKQ